MKTYLAVIIFSLPLIFLIFLILELNSYSYVEINGEEIIVEIPNTEKEKQTGLMFKEELCDNCGMLFVFEEEDFHGFWMKNTIISLDMIFIDRNMKIVDVLHAVPCSEDPCESYTPKEKALYVLEVNGNKFNEEIIREEVGIFIEG